MNYLIQGTTGAGKTWYALRAAYLICERQIPFSEIQFHLDSVSDSDIANFLRSERCVHFQVNAATTFEDFITTATLNAFSSSLSSTPVNKPLVDLLLRASNSTRSYAVIFDDIDRADIGLFLGPLVATLSLRHYTMLTKPSEPLTVPNNVTFFFTASSGYRTSQAPISFLTAMDGIKTLDSSDRPLRRVYKGQGLTKAFQLANRLMTRSNQFIADSQLSTSGLLSDSFQLGAGYFIVGTDQPLDRILRNIREKFKYFVDPFIRSLWRDGILSEDPCEFLDSLEVDIEGEILAESHITGVSKIAIETGNVFPHWGPETAYTFLTSEINAKAPKELKPRDVMEAVIDAMLCNGLLPLDYVFSELLMNQDIGWVENERIIGERGAYLIEESRARDFVYLTPKGDKKAPHAFYSTDSTSGWHSDLGPAAYRFRYNGSSGDKIFVPLNGFRKKSMTIETSRLSDTGNAAVAYRSCYRLVHAYLSNLESAYRSLATSKPAYSDLADYVFIEKLYHAALHDVVRRTKGSESEKYFEYCKRILSLRSLWQTEGSSIAVDCKAFELLRCGNSSADDISDLHRLSTDQIQIEFRKVPLMTQSRDYQALMDGLNVHQIIFQGPPGTSKTFESKRLILRSLNPSAECLRSENPDRDDIDHDLSPFKLNQSDYSDPEMSPALDRGGWDLVQFHPAYSYEDFIRGIQVTAHNGQPVYKTVNRIFGNIAELAKVAHNRCNGVDSPKFYLLVDEINRADLATVFGELIYGLEYRNSRMSTPYAVMSQSQGTESFEIEVSTNLYLIGTMNTADKSIGTMDYAIRRRFLFIDSPVDRNVVVHAQQSYSNDRQDDSIETLLFDAVQHIFDVPTFFNDDYHRNDVRIGHTFFLRTSSERYAEHMAERIAYQVVPILREYVRDGILYPVNKLESQSPHSTSLLPGDKDNIPAIGRQLLFYATHMGEFISNELISEATVYEYVLSICHELEL